MADSPMKHVSFDDDAGAHSSASDEDTKPVEVFLDQSSTYRRKSSLVSSDAMTPMQLRRAQQPKLNKTDCLVHQFFETQRRAGQHPPNGRQSLSRQNSHQQQLPVQAKDLPPHNGLDKVMDPKGICQSGHKDSKGRCLILDGGNSSENSDIGQPDQKCWKTGITAPQPPSDAPSRTSTPLPDHHETEEETHSRLLTKKQLSEMAWGVRELSRRLGSMRLKFKVKSIFLLTKLYDSELVPKTRELTRWLLSKDRDVRYTVYVQQNLKTNKRFDAQGLLDDVAKEFLESGEISKEAVENGEVKKRLRYWTEEMCKARPHTFDFVITLGGDGTVLYASWLFQRIVPPVLSFSLGSLGFLTKFDFEEYQRTLTQAFNEGVTVSLRLRFEGTVMRSEPRLKNTNKAGGESDEDDERKRDLVEELIGEEKDDEHTHRPDGTHEILNEIVVDRGPNPTMSTTEIFGDDEYFTSVLADGVCVSTPTGSTAYNLAAGGSLCHPENPVMLVTSICAHTLSFRPIILPDTIVLRIGVPYDARTSSWASFDGRERVELRAGDYVTISASRYPFASVQPPGRRSEEWINSISAKLGWNTRQKQKAFKEWDESEATP
ncbi:ATP-NAD kinase-like domain-containing protein [Diplogelasinospora grovesii]|uniref:ATP-NAD kinase-like domain-containing protein n=1 Tax=Diplogelasinospora grovesii TaxID=303347 RepID=A0AAN6N308_9PEZI|nr:ATP-NAD kinase-like domain-containing protein [Diplogelasinospora grovesii]